MTEYLRVHTERGRLSYLPDEPTSRSNRHSVCTSTPSDYLQTRGPIFNPRSRRPQRIHIARVPPDYSVAQRKSRRGRPVVIEKLAGPRENAKRFLRSFIASHGEKVSPTPTRAPSVGGGDNESSSSAEGQRAGSSETMRTAQRHSVGGPVSGMISRPVLVDNIRSASGRSTNSRKSMVSSITQTIPDEKPLASGNGISVGIALAEPVLFLQGFEQNGDSERSTAMLRGSLHLRVTKSAKIKAVTLKFKGKATTKWPEGIPPKKTEFEETDHIMSHTWPFFNAQFPTAEHGTCADHVELHERKESSLQVPMTGKNGKLSFDFDRSPNNSSTNLSSKEAKRLSLQVNQSRSFGKGESSTSGPSIAQKGYRTFQPGDYIYNFELPLDSHLPETIDVDLGSVKYELEAVIERSGAFRANLVGTKEVVLIRAPSEGSLEQVEPIAISRNWEDQLHYDIVISGKSFPLGSQVPIAFKLTPLAKVQCHRIKVFVTENVEYYCNNKRVHRIEPTRKVQLFEKRADGPANSTFPGSSMRIISGGGVPYDQRAAAARGEMDNVTLQDSTNLLGNLEGETNIGPTEMEFNVQLPSCHAQREKEQKLQKLHFDTTYQNIQVHHWIKIVMRLSRPDQNDPSKRRHFEISIDSPFHILSCRATQANTALPAYSSPETGEGISAMPECGCPGAPVRRGSPASFIPTINALNSARTHNNVPEVSAPQLARPQQAHIGGPTDPRLQRPIHLLRQPSFNPPAFDEEQPPPPLQTPPPQYDSIASPTSGLADYFSRLSDAYDEDSDGEGQNARTPGRVDVPLTPGSRINRSMDERRTWLPLDR
ncbi:hypothetical protein B0J12DRAFT_781371 [Macrophomina phaseolina]|uniref:Arrestin C-terminal-like domain-containing protein n=1 Tax=Macrophomina phaseolina TaxID=35725 RepID=A0ABQ8GSZ5_9PEZI|nr:hypothetical protein B0J12DRAFT_781371 [Macrophomina phaseolina]